jgi:hypothetical protein
MMEWDEMKDAHETRSIGRNGKGLIHHLELERERRVLISCRHVCRQGGV